VVCGYFVCFIRTYEGRIDIIKQVDTVKTHIDTNKIIEEIFNSISHGLGVAAGIVALTLGIIFIPGGVFFRVGFIIYTSCLILLMLASTLYHSLKFTGAKKVFRTIDHSSIFLLIAGTFTPFVAYLYNGGERIALLAIIWSVAVAGISITASVFLPKKITWGELAFYICFGWMGLLLIPKMGHVGAAVVWFLAAGGIAYTLGVIPFALKTKFSHFSWHIFVIAGALLHFFAIINLV